MQLNFPIVDLFLVSTKYILVCACLRGQKFALLRFGGGSYPRPVERALKESI